MAIANVIAGVFDALAGKSPGAIALISSVDRIQMRFAIADLVGCVDFMKPNIYVVHTTSAIALAKLGVTLALLLLRPR